MSKGLFITIEGGEGSGKTTQAQLLDEWMNKRNISHVLTKEPGSDILECKKIRKLLLDPANDLVPRAELLLFLSDRAQHVEKLIKPGLSKGINVICDRYSDSTRVYQSARGLSRTKIDLLLDFTTNSLNPDITFILDVPVTIGLERAKAKSIYKDGDRMEQAGLKYHEDVRYGFLKLAENILDQRFYLIETERKSVEEVHKEIVDYLSKKLWEQDVEALND
jgi:dTMP kinase